MEKLRMMEYADVAPGEAAVKLATPERVRHAARSDWELVVDCVLASTANKLSTSSCRTSTTSEMNGE